MMLLVFFSHRSRWKNRMESGTPRACIPALWTRCVMETEGGFRAVNVFSFVELRRVDSRLSHICCIIPSLLFEAQAYYADLICTW